VGYERVVRTRVPVQDELWEFGSGYVVAPERVLTARHVLDAGGAEPHVGQACEVRAWPCLPPDGPWTAGVVVWLHPDKDAALIAVPGIGTGMDPVRWGHVEGAATVPWNATGYPIAGLDERGRTEEGVSGTLEPASGSSTGSLALTVTSRTAQPDARGDTGWEGLSGAVVFCGAHVVGVITTVPADWNHSLEGVRLTALAGHPDLAARLGFPVELEPVAANVWGTPTPAPAPGAPADNGERQVGERISAGVEAWQDRDELRAELRAHLVDSRSRRIVNVTGRRGIGKSATVAKVMSEFEQAAPSRSPLDDIDALVYLSPRTEGGTITLAGVFETVTRLLPGPVAHRLRKEWDTARAGALPALWEALKDRRCVVVLDNLDDLQDPDGRVRDPELVTFFESVCRTPYRQHLLCTSQRSLVLPSDLGVHIFERRMKTGLDGTHAVALLRSNVAAELSLDRYDDDELERATQRLAGIPRGLEHLGSKLTRDPQTLAELLESDRTLDELMEELVSEAFLRLDGDSRPVVELLAVAEVPLPDRDVPGLLSGLVAPEIAKPSLRALVRSRDVGYDPDTSRVRLHPLDADWIWRELADNAPARQVDLDRRLAAWYAGQHKPPDSWRTLSDVTSHRREFHHRWRAGDHDEAMAVLVGIAEFLARKGESAALTHALDAAEPVVHDGPARVNLERCRADLEFFGGTFDRSEAAGRRALAAAEAAGMHEITAELEIDLASVQRHRGQPGEAVQVLRSVLARRENGPSHPLRLEALLELGLCSCYLQQWQEAEDAADELERLLLPEDPRKSRAAPYDIRALARLGSGDHAGALAAADVAIERYLDSPNQDNVGYLYNLRGLVHLECDELAEATAELQRGVEGASAYRIGRLEGICATNLAWTHLRAGRWAEALSNARRGTARLTSTGVAEAATPDRLEVALTDPGLSTAAVRAVLAEAVAASSQNADFYRPSADVLTQLAEGMTHRGRS
jgi:tetratricopeptide (TPR) repeat protein